MAEEMGILFETGSGKWIEFIRGNSRFHSDKSKATKVSKQEFESEANRLQMFDLQNIDWYASTIVWQPTLTLESFLRFARERHADQTSMSGEPYIEHIIRVAENTRKLLAKLPDGMISPWDKEEALLVAVGHDLIEDGRATEDDIRAIGGSESLIRRLRALSRMDPKPVYQSWITSIAESGDIVVIIVKLADNLDNNSDVRIAALPPEKQSIRRRYERAYSTLNAKLVDLIASFLSGTSQASVS
jgi:(p)ppGpp synthase/HD superfamily hydrolase